ncbi:PREDICTED: inositol polyphosphate 1-phosphatase isoform X2 [Chinchilla lanigera]|uniref:inositol polyphosphate 1-phosphatase isoform X2 n=1 Tax=Chinchilla lanigera TaxID=34839 RepID=UPI0006969D5D|nr:PREDICTED: inositol polyphosphate 1-phosphatase isoform X2 [Chinchilla lanigera]
MSLLTIWFIFFLGEKVTIKVCATEEETAELLSKVLSGNKSASEALAKVVHQDAAFKDPALDSVDISISQEDLGIWVDPIDSTYQYIRGATDVKAKEGIFPCGLQCVTILIGVFDLQSGLPVMGVINQPFVSQDQNTLRWKGECYWGLSYMGINIHSLQLDISESSRIEKDSVAGCPHPASAVISTSEKETVKAALSQVCGGKVFWAAGAGYKSLCVVQGLVDIYMFSEDTTFKWDTCAAHAILRAMGGGILDMKGCLEDSAGQWRSLPDMPELLYNVENKGATGVDCWANKGGLIAYRSCERLATFLKRFVYFASVESHT